MEEKDVSKVYENLNREKELEGRRQVLAKKFGPAFKRTKKTWQKIVFAFGFEFVRDAEGFNDEQLERRLGVSSFQRRLKEKFRQQNFERVNSK